MVIVALCFWDIQQHSSTVRLIMKYSNCTVNPLKYGKEKQGMHFRHHCQASLNSLLWSGTEAILNARDPNQNPDQTRILSYKPGQRPSDPVDPNKTWPGWPGWSYSVSTLVWQQSQWNSIFNLVYRIAGNFRREKFSEISEKNNVFRKYIS